MIKRIFFIFLFLFTLTSHASNAQTQGEPLIVEHAIVHKVQSAIVPGQIYELRIGLPEGYQNSPDKEYPILVVLDGQWGFLLVSEIAGNLAQDGMIPEAITVGITWGGEGDDPGLLRTRDFIRPNLPYIPNSGGANLFLSALTDELIPYVESLYRVGEKRVLLGVSLGGLFTSYAMLEKPGHFDGYIAIAGSYFMDWAYFDERLALMYGAADLKKVRSFLSVGSLDTNQVFVEMLNNSIESAGLKGFKHKYKVIKGVGHAGVEPIAYTRGLQYVFKRPFLKLSEEFLQQYAGEYEGGLEGFPPFPTTVSVVGVGTIAIGGEGEATEYIAESKTKFYIKGINSTAEFTEDGQLIINSGGTLLYFNRVSQ
ncbi:MAG TPA: alpha/beta hydrolase-fold protein [Gammaproteobacteria bacterium]